MPLHKYSSSSTSVSGSAPHVSAYCLNLLHLLFCGRERTCHGICVDSRGQLASGSLLPPEVELTSSSLVAKTSTHKPSQQPEVSVQMSFPLSLPDLCTDKPPPPPPLCLYNVLFLYPVHCKYFIKVGYTLSKMPGIRSGSAFRSGNICM